MFKGSFCLVLTIVIIATTFVDVAFPFGMSCDGSQLKTDSGWVFIPSGQTVEVMIGGVRYRCVGCGRCTPISQAPSTSGYTGGFRSTGNWKMDMMLVLVQSFMQGFMKGLQGGQVGKSSVQTHTRVQVDKESEERDLKEWQNEVKKQIEEMQKQYALMRENEFKEKKNRLINKLKGPDSLSDDSSSLKSLKCSAYWSLEAAKIISSDNGDSFEKAKIYSENSAKAMQGDLSNCPDIQIGIDVPGSDKSSIYKAEFQQELLKVVTQEMNERVNLLNEIKKKKDEKSQEVVKIEKRIKEIEDKKMLAKNEIEIKEYNSLLNEALKLLEDAKKEEKKADEELIKLNQEIKAIVEINKTVFNVKGVEGK